MSYNWRFLPFRFFDCLTYGCETLFLHVLQLRQWNLAWCDFPKSFVTWMILYFCCHLFFGAGPLIARQRTHTASNTTQDIAHATQRTHKNTLRSSHTTTHHNQHTQQQLIDCQANIAKEGQRSYLTNESICPQLHCCSGWGEYAMGHWISSYIEVQVKVQVC